MSGLPRARVALLATTLLVAPGCFEPPVALDDLDRRLAELERPNIVLIVIDTLRADWLTPYGDQPYASPEIARWAREGVLFENALAQSSWTKISMASMFTSRWPQGHGVNGYRDGLGSGATTLAELFRDAGYQTLAVQSNGWLAQAFGFQQGFDKYLFASSPNISEVVSSSVWAHAGNVYQASVSLLDEATPGQPFFLYLHFMDVHEFAAPSDIPRVAEGAEGAYRAAIVWVDSVLADIRRDLERRGLDDSTVLVIASDHGESFGEHGVYGHARNVLTPVLHVPLIFRLPFTLAEPLRVSPQVPNVDLFPTLLELAGLPSPDGIDGRSLVPLMLDPSGASARASYASLTARVFPDARLQHAMTDGRWTFVRDIEGAPDLLFDREVDPGENVNVAEFEAEAALRLRESIESYVALEPDPGGVESDARIDPKLAQQLRALGYLQ